MKYDVFISYRREGGDTLAQLIYDRLTHRGYRVFLDIESLNSGKFNEKLLEVIEECKDLVVILPPNALDRCHNEGDWLYRELKHGIEKSKNVIPVMMKGFYWPDDIPQGIAEVKNYNGIIDNKDYFDAVIDKITSLLHSKPVIGWEFFEKLKSKNKSFAERVKRRKKIIAGICVLTLAGVGVTGLLQHQKEQEKIKEESYVQIKLLPQDSMSATQFYDAIEIVEKRVEILAGEYDWDWEEDKDTVTMSLPMEVFHEIDIEQILQCYLTRPTDIFLGRENEAEGPENCFAIERSAIESVDVVNELPMEADLSSYNVRGIENMEDCRFVVLTVDESVVSEAKAWMESIGDERYTVSHDNDLFSYPWYYRPISLFENGNQIYLLDVFQYGNIQDLLVYNYSNEALETYLMYSICYPVQWEDQEAQFGANQCLKEELKGATARYDFSTYIEEFTEGEYQDTIRIFKERFDTLGTPYAFGTRVDNEYTFSVLLDPTYMNNIIASSISAHNGLEILTNYYEVVNRYNVETVEIVENGDGTYGIEIIPSDYWKQYYCEDVLANISSEETIYLCIDAYPEIPIDGETFADAYDGESFRFTGLSSAEVEKMEEDTVFFYEFLKMLALGDTFPHTYKSDAYFSDEEEIEYLVPDSTISRDQREQYEKYLEEIEEITEYSVEVSSIGQTATFYITLEKSEQYETVANELCKQIFTDFDMDSGNCADISFTFYDGDKKSDYINYDFGTDRYNHTQKFTAYYYGLSDERKVVFDQIFNIDEFYRQFTVSDYYITEGHISFDN